MIKYELSFFIGIDKQATNGIDAGHADAMFLLVTNSDEKKYLWLPFHEI